MYFVNCACDKFLRCSLHAGLSKLILCVCLCMVVGRLARQQVAALWRQAAAPSGLPNGIAPKVFFWATFRWMHPAKECGRDMVPVPPDSPERHQMWRSNVESRNEDSAPEVGSKHPCWCCHWIRKVRQRHRQGAVICCTVSNIFQADWVENYSAGSSELSDDRAKEFGLPEESFRNGRPEGWGQGEILIEGWDLSNDRKFQRKFQRKAPVHSRTSLPLGSGCRWERHALDGMDFPVYVFFMP